MKYILKSRIMVLSYSNGKQYIFMTFHCILRRKFFSMAFCIKFEAKKIMNCLLSGQWVCGRVVVYWMIFRPKLLLKSITFFQCMNKGMIFSFPRIKFFVEFSVLSKETLSFLSLNPEWERTRQFVPQVSCELHKFINVKIVKLQIFACFWAFFGVSSMQSTLKL